MQESKNSHNLKSTWAWIPYLATFIAIGAALTYFLGRLYLDSYYGYYNIPITSLNFMPQEYMYFCVPVFVMLLGISPWFWFIYDSFKYNHPFGIPPNITSVRKTVSYVIFIVAPILGGINLSLTFFLMPASFLPLWDSFMNGISLGLISFPLSWLLYKVMSRLSATSSPDQSVAVFIIIWFSLYLISLLPIFTTNLAIRSAKADYTNLPIVNISMDKLPGGLQQISTDNRTVAAKILLINDGWLYLSVPSSIIIKDMNLSDNKTIFVVRLSDTNYFDYNLINK